MAGLPFLAWSWLSFACGLVLGLALLWATALWYEGRLEAARSPWRVRRW